MVNFRLLIVIGCAVSTIVGLVYLGSTQQRGSHDGGNTTSQNTESGAQPNLEGSSNPLELQKAALNQGVLSQALGCVDSDGKITCGPYKGEDGLYYAALSGSVESATDIITDNPEESQIVTALNIATAVGDEKMVDHLLTITDGQAILDRISNDRHPVVHAAAYGHLNLLQYFIERGFDVNQRFSDGYTDLFLEALLGRQRVAVFWLLENGYKIDCDLRFPNGRSYTDVAEQVRMQDVSDMLRETCSK